MHGGCDWNCLIKLCPANRSGVPSAVPRVRAICRLTIRAPLLPAAGRESDYFAGQLLFSQCALGLSRFLRLDECGGIL
jgi:hypothetical protein